MRPLEILIPITLAVYLLWPFITGRVNPRLVNLLACPGNRIDWRTPAGRRLSLANDPLICSDRDTPADSHSRNYPSRR